MAYDPTQIASTTNPLPVQAIAPTTYDPNARVSESNPKPVEVVP